MRILVIGDWHSEVHEEWVFRAFTTLGHEVFPFGWHSYFKPRRPVTGPAGKLERFVLKIQNRLILGPKVAALNRDVLQAVDRLSSGYGLCLSGDPSAARDPAADQGKTIRRRC